MPNLQEFRSLKSFWNSRETVVYPKPTVENQGFPQEVVDILTNIGVPKIDNGYHFFFPASSFSLQVVEEERFMVLGSPYMSGKIDVGRVLLHIATGEVSFWSPTLFEIKFKPAPLSPMNQGLISFLYFQQHITVFIEEVFLPQTRKPFREAQEAYFRMGQLLYERDSSGLGERDDYMLWWRRILSNVCFGVEEVYDQFIERNNTPFYL